MENVAKQNAQSKKEKVYHVVETKDTVYYSRKKIDAIYKHVEFKYKEAVYKMTNYLPKGKTLINLEHHWEIVA